MFLSQGADGELGLPGERREGADEITHGCVRAAAWEVLGT